MAGYFDRCYICDALYFTTKVSECCPACEAFATEDNEESELPEDRVPSHIEFLELDEEYEDDFEDY